MNRFARLLPMLALLPAFAPAQSNSRVIRAGAWITPAGEIEKDATLVITDGRITAVGGDVPKNAEVDEFDRAVLCPGLIDCHAALSAQGQLRETADPIEPLARARDSFDRFHPHLAAALHAGITTFALCPDDGNLVGGRIAICQTYGAQRAASILTDAGPMKLSISPAAFLLDREPTSRSGALAMMRSVLSAARDAKPPGGPLTELTSGKLPAFVATPAGADVLSMLAIAEEFKLKLTLIHSQDARDIAAEVARSGMGVVTGPFDFASSPRQASAPGVLEAKGVKVAIAGGLPGASADSLRIGAAVAARNGLPVAAARRAITAVPAEFLGIADQAGRLEKGRRADVVVFSGDPLDLRSRVLAVYVGGVRAAMDVVAEK